MSGIDPELRRRLEQEGQGHLLAHALGLALEPREAFLRSVATYPWEELVRAARGGALPTPPELRPPQALTLRRQQAVGGLRPRLAGLGRARLQRGEVATLLLAGGQGSRLGAPGPKGCFVLGPSSDRSLYAILAERVVAAGLRAGRAVPLVVLVAEETEQATREAFEVGARPWGLSEGQVTFVRQGQLPAFDAAGRALLKAPGELALSPDGHGGALSALAAAGVLARLLERGVRVLTTFQVDNPLALPLDPVMLGWQIERGAEVVGKAARKVDPEERVGVFARDLEGRTRVVEYSELAGVGGAEALVLGSIAVHALDLPWLNRLAARGPQVLPLHVARRRMLTWEPLGGAETREAVKLERFLFDAFPLAGRVEVQEVSREREFAPIKNVDGTDSPASARALVAAEVCRWHRRRGLPQPSEPRLEPLRMDADDVD